MLVKERRMRKALTYIFTLILLSNSGLYAQSEDTVSLNNHLRVSTGYMQSQVIRFTQPPNATQIEQGIAREIGFTYAYPMDDKLWMGIGLSYLSTTNEHHTSIIKSQLKASELPINFDQTAELIYLPAFLRYDLTNWFSLKMGMSIAIAVARTDIYNQNGLGFFGGGILHYTPNPRFDFGIEPNVHVTAMLPIPQEFYQQHLLLIGANAYVAVKF